MKQQARRLVLGLSLGALAMTASSTARAEVTSIKVTYQSPFGTFGGNKYVYVEATVDGTITSTTRQGSYSVPAVMIYPVSGGNGHGWLDVPNSSFFEIYPREDACGMVPCDNYSFASPCETRGDFLCMNPDSVPLSENKYERFIVQGGRNFTEDFIFDQGYTYLSMQWNKAVTEHFGPTPPDGERTRLAYGTIERPEDSFPIILDAVTVLKDPSTFDANGFNVAAPMPVTKVLAEGYSQSAAHLQTILLNRLHLLPDGSPLIDGMLLIGVGASCHNSKDNPPTYHEFFLCGPGPANSTGPTKVMHIAMQTALEAFGAVFVRREFTVDPTDMDCAMGPGPGCDPNPNYYAYELPGVAHLSTKINDMSFMGATRQNPADPRPFFRARVKDLYAWMEMDVPPPPPINVAGTIDQNMMFVPETDADGNWLGGIRLPHMETILTGSVAAGAPLGTYGGVDPQFIVDPTVFPPVAHIWPMVGGIFIPFPEEEVMRRYPTHEDYVERIRLAAQNLLDNGYILQADYDAYIAKAELEYPQDVELPPPPEFSGPGDDDDGAGGGCGCTAASSSRSSGAWMLLMMPILFVLRRRRMSK